MTIISIVLVSVLFFALLYLLIKKNKAVIIQFFLKMKMKHTFGTLREAIHNADADKSRTGRKNIVVYNTDSGCFEPVQKKKLKQLVAFNKRKKDHSFNSKRVKLIEKKSLYVTR